MKRHATGMGGPALLSAILMGGCAINPTAFTPEEISAVANERLARVTSDQEPVTRAIDLPEAMARALKYNLDHKVEVYETALRTAELDLAHYNMLPNAVASAGYAVRDNPSASSSSKWSKRHRCFTCDLSPERSRPSLGLVSAPADIRRRQ